MASGQSSTTSRMKRVLARRTPVALEGARFLAFTLRALTRGRRAAITAVGLAVVAAISLAVFFAAPSYRTPLAGGLVALAALFMLYMLVTYVRTRLWIADHRRNAMIAQAIDDSRLFAEHRIMEMEARLTERLTAELDSVSLSLAETKRQSRQVLSTLSSRLDNFNLELRAGMSRTREDLEAFGARPESQVQTRLMQFQDRLDTAAAQEATTRARLANTVEDVKTRFAALETRLEAAEKTQDGASKASRRDISSAIDMMSERLAAISAETRALDNKISASLQGMNLRWSKLEAELRASLPNGASPTDEGAGSNVSPLFAERR